VLLVVTHSATAALERLASSIAIAEELKLGAVRQEIPVPPALRHVRFIYFKAVDGSLKVCNVLCVVGLVSPDAWQCREVFHAPRCTCVFPLAV
jgi:hypothetical protein